ncbi:MAG: hypothetical protein H6Q86_4385 [candidate division NC10 bacterium]|nr:hypothetical protein [candidate division NC10 bacterium]
MVRSIMGPAPGPPSEQESGGNRERKNLWPAPRTTVLLSDVPLRPFSCAAVWSQGGLMLTAWERWNALLRTYARLPVRQGL